MILRLVPMPDSEVRQVLLINTDGKSSRSYLALEVLKHSCCNASIIICQGWGRGAVHYQVKEVQNL